MIKVRKTGERGVTRIDWLLSYHTFSFSDYHDPKHMGFRALRVINEDEIAPESGFGTHAHHDMEIITYVLSGELTHRDSMGNGSAIRPGDVQRMTAGKGVTHSEVNYSNKEPVHLLQIWILPDTMGLDPSYEQKAFSSEQKRNKLCLVVSGSAKSNAVRIHQDVELFAADLGAEKSVEHVLGRGRHTWLQLTRGSVRVNGELLRKGDGAAVSNEKGLMIQAIERSEFLLFDLA